MKETNNSGNSHDTLQMGEEWFHGPIRLVNEQPIPGTEGFS